MRLCLCIKWRFRSKCFRSRFKIDAQVGRTYLFQSLLRTLQRWYDTLCNLCTFGALHKKISILTTQKKKNKITISCVLYCRKRWNFHTLFGEKNGSITDWKSRKTIYHSLC